MCGVIKVTAMQASTLIGACHCSSCRRWSGGPFLSVDSGTQVTFSGAENIGIYDSSEWAERGFCKQCGTHLFYRLKHNQQHNLPVGLFGNPQNFTFKHQVFIEEKPEYYCFSNKTKKMTGPEAFAYYTP